MPLAKTKEEFYRENQSLKARNAELAGEVERLTPQVTDLQTNLATAESVVKKESARADTAETQLSYCQGMLAKVEQDKAACEKALRDAMSVCNEAIARSLSVSLVEHDLCEVVDHLRARLSEAQTFTGQQLQNVHKLNATIDALEKELTALRAEKDAAPEAPDGTGENT